MSVQNLASEWVAKKATIKAMQDELIAIEQELLTMVDTVEDGSKTSKVDGYKITVKRPVNRTIDGEAWETVKDKIPAELWPVKIKVTPDDSACKKLAKENPKLWMIASEAITEKEGKPNFTIEAIE
jgi:hypothetical protein